MSGVYGPIYKAEINVHKQVPDSLQWSHRGSSFDNTIQAQKAVTLGDYIYVFAQQDNGAAVTSTHINDGKTWTPLQALPEICKCGLFFCHGMGKPIIHTCRQ